MRFADMEATMDVSLNMRIYELKNEKNSDERNKLIEEYMPFIIKLIAEETNSYVEIENSEELSIAILGFNEAIDRYEYGENSFLSYSKLVIISRLRNYFKSKNYKMNKVVSLDELSEKGLMTIEKKNQDNTGNLKSEIEEFKNELFYFGIDIEKLIDEKPKHVQTREKAVWLGTEISKVNDIVERMYKKGDCP